MIRKIISILSTLSLVLSFSFLPTSVFAGDKDKDSLTIIGQEAQFDKYTKVKLISHNVDAKGKLISNTFEATISSIPAILDNGDAIVARWLESTDSLGNTYFKSGDNLFNATASLNGRVSVADSGGKLNVWNPDIYVGYDSFLPLVANSKVQLLKVDPINKNYNYNVLEWTYTIPTGNIFTKKIVTIKRWVRIIEGSLQELFILSDNPKDDLRVMWRAEDEKDTVGKLSPAVAYDSSKDVNNLKVDNNKYGFTISASEFNNKIYPITVDPLSIFTPSSDGFLQRYGNTFAACQSAASAYADASSNAALYLLIGAVTWGSNYFSIDRSSVAFDTSSIPDNAIIQSASIQLRTIGDGDAAYSVIVQSGMPTYPHVPMVIADYDKTYYSGNGGETSSISFVEGSFSSINLNSTGISWISKTGTTKFMLRGSHDVNNIAPAYTSDLIKYELQVYASEGGTGLAPILGITYTLPITTPTVVTTSSFDQTSSDIWLRGYLTNNGGETCVVKFQYGTTIAYGQETYSLSGITTGGYFDIQAVGLSAGTTYHFRSVATNSAGSGYGLDGIFTTLPLAPTGFSSTAGNLQNVLNWTKGTGATNTMVRFSTVSYPTTITDGTVIYNSTASTYTHTPLTAGVTYYYSAWSETGNGYSTTYTTCYGSPYALTAPVVETRDATGVGIADADLNGYLSALNQVGGTVTVSFEWDTDSGAPYANSKAAGTVASPSSFTANIDTLPAATMIYYRAKAVGTNGTAYGLQKTFTTGAISSPVMDTTTATAVNLNYMTINGTLTSDGGATTTAWFKWGLSADNLNNTTASVTGLTTGSTLNCNLIGLTPNTTYYFQVVGQNSAGIGYGDVVSQITSSAGAADVTTNNVVSVGTGTAILSGTLTIDGGVDCEVQFEWDVSTGAPYANSTGWQAGKRQGNIFTAVISGLTVNTDYYFRASAKNDDGTVYGSEKTFKTIFLSPSNFTAKSTGSTTMSLSWTNQADQTIIIFKENGYPVDRLDGTQVYFGNSTSYTHSNLTSGVTYFYRAWSWSSDGTWSTDYAEDASTTSAVLKSESNIHPVIIDFGDVNSRMYQSTDSSKLHNLPFYDNISYMLDNTEGMPSKDAFWGLLAFVVAMFVGWKVWKATKLLFAGLAVVAVILFIASQQDLLPMWIPILMGITAIGLGALLQANVLGGKE